MYQFSPPFPTTVKINHLGVITTAIAAYMSTDEVVELETSLSAQDFAFDERRNRWQKRTSVAVTTYYQIHRSVTYATYTTATIVDERVPYAEWWSGC